MQTNKQTLGKNIVDRLEKRICLAYLEAAIMTCLKNEQFIDSSGLIEILKKYYITKLSHGTLFPVLYRLERSGYIQKLLIDQKLFYVLTKKGKIALNDIEANIRFFQGIFKKINRNEVDMHAFNS